MAIRLTNISAIFQAESLEKSMIFIRTNERTNERTLVLNTICASRVAASAARACGTVIPPAGVPCHKHVFYCHNLKT